VVAALSKAGEDSLNPKLNPNPKPAVKIAASWLRALEVYFKRNILRIYVTDFHLANTANGDMLEQ